MNKSLRSRLKEQELRRLYLEEKRSFEDIARLYGASRVAVWKYCKSMGLKSRNRSEARIEAQKKGKVPQDFFEINDQFFSKWTSSMAYVLGLIVTDGCISKTGTISLSINDKELLEKVRETMGSGHKIKSYGYQERLYTFRFTRKNMVADLNSLGVFPRKSLNINFPDVPDSFLTHFVRGVFDGDGSVFFEKRSPGMPLRTSFVSSSKDFIKTLESRLREVGMPKRSIYYHNTKNCRSYMFRYAHKDSIKLFAILYKTASKNSLFMKRKYDKFLSVFQGV